MEMISRTPDNGPEALSRLSAAGCVVPASPTIEAPAPCNAAPSWAFWDVRVMRFFFWFVAPDEVDMICRGADRKKTKAARGGTRCT